MLYKFTARIRLTTQNGIIMLPPLLLPYGGEISYVSPTKKDHSRTSSFSFKRRPSSKKHKKETPITTTTTD